MHRTTKAAAIAGGLLLAVAGVAVPATAVGGHERAELSPPDDTSCWSISDSLGRVHGMTCFEWNGDDQWVKDTYKNGAQFRVHVRTEYGKDRSCTDNTAGWTQCDYNHKEYECVKYHAYYPPHKPGDIDGDHSDGPGDWAWIGWYSTTSGQWCNPD